MIPALITWYDSVYFKFIWLRKPIVVITNPQVKGGKQALGLLCCLQKNHWQLYKMNHLNDAEASFQNKNLD